MTTRNMKALGAAFAAAALLFGAGRFRAADHPPSYRFQEAIDLMETKGDYPAAIRVFEELAKGSDRNLAARSLLYVGLCYEKLGKDEARKAYERVVRDYADQNEAAAEARTRLAALTQPPGSNDHGAMAVRRVWADAEDDEGGVSSDGRYLSYVHWTTGDLAIRNLATKENRLLTHKGSWSESEEFALSSAISPDNKQVAFTWFNKDRSADLRLVSLDGTNPRVLYQNPEASYPSPLGWSPDGKQILTLISRKDRTNQIALISAANGSARVLKTLDWRSPTSMAFSPDGRYIAYDFPPNEDSSNRDIYLLATDGSREIPLVQGPANDFLLGWAPDGKSVLFGSDRSGSTAAWVVEVVNGKPQGNPQLIRPDMGPAHPMGFTQKGAFFYSLTKSSGGDIYTATIDPATWKVTSSPTRIVERFVGFNLAPAWSPDGRLLAYISRRGSTDSPQLTLVIRSTASGEERELPLKFSYIPNFRWSPDSHSILFSGTDRKGKPGIIKLNTETGEAAEIVQLENGGYAGAHRPELTPDGKMLVFGRFKGGLSHTSIVVRDLASGEETSVISKSGPSQAISWHALSPDGQKIAFKVSDQNTRSSTLNVMPTTGGQSHEILVMHDPEDIRQIEWTPDGQELVFAKVGAHPRTELWGIPAGGGQPHALLTMEGFIGLSLHPSGRQIALGGGQHSADVWVMENFLPALKASQR